MDRTAPGRRGPAPAEVREAALRPLAGTGTTYRWIALALLGLVAWGVAGYVTQLRLGLGAAGYADRGFWGIYEADLVAFIALSYGGALVSAILRLTRARWRGPITRLAEATALVSLLVGMSFALIHLGRPDRIWRLVAAPQLASPIVWDFVVITTYLGATAIFLYLPLVPDLAILRDHFERCSPWRARVYGVLALRWRGSPSQRRALARGTLVVAIAIVPLAVFVHSVLSWAFSLTGRPGWSSTIFAPYFVVGALYSGVAMVVLVVAGFRAGYRLDRFITPMHFRYLGYLLVTLDASYLYFTFSELLTEGYVMSEEAVPVLQALLVDRYAPYFWLFVVAGGILPLLLVALPATRTVPGIVAAAALVVGAMWLKRLLIVVPVAARPLITGAWGDFRLTWVAVSVTVAAAAAIPLLLMLFFKLVPILPAWEMEEIEAEATP